MVIRPFSVSHGLAFPCQPGPGYGACDLAALHKVHYEVAKLFRVSWETRGVAFISVVTTASTRDGQGRQHLRSGRLCWWLPAH